MPGWIKIHRDIVTKDIYIQPPLYLRVFERLVIEANHCCKKIPFGKGERLVRRGERVTSIRQIAEWVAWYERGILRAPNPKTIREILTYLESKDIIEVLDYSSKGNRQETHYKVVNYWLYQKCDTSKVTANGQVSTQSLDTNKNDKELQEKNKRTYGDFFEELWSHYPRKKGKGSVSDTQKKKLYNIGKEELLRCIERFERQMTAEKRAIERYPYGGTFFNSAYVDYLDVNYEAEVDKLDQKKDILSKYLEG